MKHLQRKIMKTTMIRKIQMKMKIINKTIMKRKKKKLKTFQNIPYICKISLILNKKDITF